jgi:Arc/MetJ family transcription regulator
MRWRGWRGPGEGGRRVKITVEIDRALLEDAAEALGVRSFEEAIEIALRRVASRHSEAEAWRLLEGSDLSWESTEELSEYRRKSGNRPL